MSFRPAVSARRTRQAKEITGATYQIRGGDHGKTLMLNSLIASAPMVHLMTPLKQMLMQKVDFLAASLSLHVWGQMNGLSVAFSPPAAPQ